MAGALLALVPPKGQQGWLAYMLSAPVYLAELAVYWLVGRHKQRTACPFLKGNFAPVPEEGHFNDLPVAGDLPDDLSGCFLRTGPNPAFLPMGGYHWFDGDGMVHACRIKDGKVGYCNRWVQTSRFKQERYNGWAAFGKIGDMEGLTGLFAIGMMSVKRALGLISNAEGAGTGNTALVFHAKRLLALHEADMPYALRVLCEGVVQTLERVTLGSQTKFTAHPKIDHATGRLHFFNYSVEAAPYLTYSVADADGNLQMSLPITIEQPVMMHDFAITENYSIFVDVPLVFDAKVMVKDGKLPFVFDRNRGTRFGLRRHDAPSTDEAVRWFNLPSRMIFHVANAFEQGGSVHLFACAMLDFDLNFGGKMEGATRPFLTRYVFNLKDGTASETRLSNISCDFPQIEQTLTGRRTRYVYAAAASDDQGNSKLEFSGIVKMDLLAEGVEAGQDSACGMISFGPSRSGGEAIFVARQGAKAEDDGYLLTYVFDENTNMSDLVVYDASTMNSTPLATVHLPQRIPYGFHALFLSEEQVQSQLPSP